MAHLLAPSEVHDEATPFRERVECGIEPRAEVGAVERLVGMLGWLMELADVHDRFVLLPISLNRLVLAEVQRPITNGPEQIRAHRTANMPALAARPQVGEHILNELFGERILSNVSVGEIAEHSIMSTKERLQCALISGAHAGHECVRFIRWSCLASIDS
jgi:hypothetical protein